LKEHPQVRSLIGKNPLTIYAIVFMVGVMVALSYFLKSSPFWLMLIVAYTVGALLNHSLFVMIHECSHNLIFKNKTGNYFASIVANLPHTLPSAVAFSRYHIKHHSFQGIHELDADLPYEWEAKMFSKNALTKALWLLVYPFVQTFRTFRLKEIKPIDGWIITNWLIQFAFDAAIIYFWGWQAFGFLIISFFFAVGLHPLGARWIQEHYMVDDPDQETYSYYGGLNSVSFNVGYHNEHHDFPSIPWNKLPELKKAAPEYYDTLKSHRSWTKLFFRFLFDKNITLYSRTIRNDRGKVQLTDEAKPDVASL
jgi:sphingolipid delta-4 desaturase